MNYVNSYDTYTYRTVQYIITTNKSSVKVIHYATTSTKIAFHVHAGVGAECTQPLSNGDDGCCPWLRHGQLWLLAWRKDEPVGLVVSTNEPRSTYWWAQIVALILGSSVAPKTRKGVMGYSLCADASCVFLAICCRALASNAWRSASGHCRMGVAVDCPSGCSCGEAVVVGADVDARAAGGRGRVLLARASYNCHCTSCSCCRSAWMTVFKSSVSEDELSEASSTSMRGTRVALDERLRSAGGPPFRPF